MKPTDKIKRLINKSDIRTDSEVDRRILGDALEHLEKLEQKKLAGTRPNIWRAIFKRPIAKLAAAAILLIGVGFAAGRLSAPQPPDVEQLRSAIYQSVLEQVNRDRQLALANIRVELKDELTQQLQRDLNEFGVRILAASGTVTNQLLIKLIQSIDTAQTKDRRWVMAALDQIEFNRLQDAAQLRKDVELLVHPESGRPMPDVPENSNPSNERSRK